MKDKNYMKQRRVLGIPSMNTIINGFHKRWKILKIPQNINNKDCFHIKVGRCISITAVITVLKERIIAQRNKLQLNTLEFLYP